MGIIASLRACIRDCVSMRVYELKRADIFVFLLHLCVLCCSRQTISQIRLIISSPTIKHNHLLMF